MFISSTDWNTKHSHLHEPICRHRENFSSCQSELYFTRSGTKWRSTEIRAGAKRRLRHQASSPGLAAVPWRTASRWQPEPRPWPLPIRPLSLPDAPDGLDLGGLAVGAPVLAVQVVPVVLLSLHDVLLAAVARVLVAHEAKGRQDITEVSTRILNYK